MLRAIVVTLIIAGIIVAAAFSPDTMMVVFAVVIGFTLVAIASSIHTVPPLMAIVIRDSLDNVVRVVPSDYRTRFIMLLPVVERMSEQFPQTWRLLEITLAGLLSDGMEMLLGLQVAYIVNPAQITDPALLRQLLDWAGVGQQRWHTIMEPIVKAEALAAMRRYSSSQLIGGRHTEALQERIRRRIEAEAAVMGVSVPRVLICSLEPAGELRQILALRRRRADVQHALRDGMLETLDDLRQYTDSPIEALEALARSDQLFNRSHDTLMLNSGTLMSSEGDGGPRRPYFPAP
jgi:regulator of protease activity HflC (stomatin/prohibitin superfamily)